MQTERTHTELRYQIITGKIFTNTSSCGVGVDARAGGDDSVKQPRSRLSVRRRTLGTHRPAQPHHASQSEQLRRGRAQARRHRRRQGLHPQGVEEPLQLPQDQRPQRQSTSILYNHSTCCSVIAYRYFSAYRSCSER